MISKKRQKELRELNRRKLYVGPNPITHRDDYDADQIVEECLDAIESLEKEVELLQATNKTMSEQWAHALKAGTLMEKENEKLRNLLHFGVQLLADEEAGDIVSPWLKQAREALGTREDKK